MKRAAGGPEEEPPGHYHGADVPVEVRTYMAKVAKGLKDAGVGYSTQLEIAEEAGYVVATRTFRDHRHSVAQDDDPFMLVKHAGRPMMLDGKQQMIFIGWVLTQNDAHEFVDLGRATRFLEGTFALEIGTSTTHAYLKRGGFVSRLTRHRTAGYKYDIESLIDLYAADVERFWEEGIRL